MSENNNPSNVNPKPKTKSVLQKSTTGTKPFKLKQTKSLIVS